MRTAPLTTLALCLSVTVLWLLLHWYWGIRHDAILYAMQGLAHLHPEIWGDDLYLRYGSQDRYTIFATLYARLIAALGIDHAAAIWTLASHAAFFLAAGGLARRLMPNALALMAVGLLVALPGVYGAEHLFHVVEDFATPRLMAEALILGAILAALQERTALVWLLCATAFVLHPIMATVGIALVLWRLMSASWSARTMAAIAAAALAALCIAGLLARGSRLQMDRDWLAFATAGARYLLLENWSADDWVGNAIPFFVLISGLIVLAPTQARTLIACSLAVGLAGVLVSAVAADSFHLALMVQAQPWRSLWLSSTIAVLTLPAIAAASWGRGPMGRSTVLLLAALYVSHAELFTLAIGGCVLGCARLASRPSQWLSPRMQNAILVCSGAILAASAIAGIATAWLSFGLAFQRLSPYPLFDEMRSFVQESSLGLIALIGVGLLVCRRPRGAAPLVVTAFALAALLTLLPFAFRQWTQEFYPDALHSAFADWRSKIPPRAEVLYADNVLFSWILLDRRSYFSQAQMATALFSRTAAMELQRRGEELGGFLRGEGLTFNDAHATVAAARADEELTLTRLCSRTRARFIVTRQDLRADPVAHSDAAMGLRYLGLKLYACTGA